MRFLYTSRASVISLLSVFVILKISKIASFILLRFTITSFDLMSEKA